MVRREKRNQWKIRREVVKKKQKEYIYIFLRKSARLGQGPLSISRLKEDLVKELEVNDLTIFSELSETFQDQVFNSRHVSELKAAVEAYKVRAEEHGGDDGVAFERKRIVDSVLQSGLKTSRPNSKSGRLNIT